MAVGRVGEVVRTALHWPVRWWSRRTLTIRLTLLATALFTFAVVTGAVLLLVLQRRALTRVLDQAALKTAADVSRQVAAGTVPDPVVPTTSGVAGVQVVDGTDSVLDASAQADRVVPYVSRRQLREIRAGARIEVIDSRSGSLLRALGRPVGTKTVIVYTDVDRIEDSQRVLTEAALIGSPLAVLLMAAASYAVVGLTLRSVAELRHGAADITAARLPQQRLPVPAAQDEIHRLAVTLNAMLDRIDAATSRQRTFVGDAAHELRSPLASLRVQLEVARLVGPEKDWPDLLDEVLIDVARLDRLVADLLALARLDEAATSPRPVEAVQLDEVVRRVVDGRHEARVTVRAEVGPVTVSGAADALQRVVINLIDNAVRYAESRVDVSLQAQPDRAGRSTAVLRVQDDGPGIAPDQRDKVFDRFYRVQESRSRDTGGTGLGLAIVRDIVTEHHGRIELAGREDGAAGLQAIVFLPADDTLPVAPTADTLPADDRAPDA